MNLVLTGFMATGKSAVGQIIARRLGRAFFDTDEMIEKETGHSVAQIFSTGGEAAFRDFEAQTVGLVALLDKAVIATGGGVPLREANMAELERQGVVVCLRATPETILGRLRNDMATRPLLQGHSPLHRIDELLRLRQKAYARCRFSVDTDGRTPDEVADLVLEATKGLLL
jgi:shikimate kinase